MPLLYAGLYSTHADLSPKYAAPLLGLTSTVGALPGVVGVPLTGVLLDMTNSWTVRGHPFCGWCSLCVHTFLRCHGDGSCEVFVSSLRNMTMCLYVRGTNDCL